MHIASALAVLATVSAVSAEWIISFRDDNTRSTRELWGNGRDCQRFGQPIGYKCIHWDQNGNQGGCTTSNWRGQRVQGFTQTVGTGSAYCIIYSRGDCTGAGTRVNPGQSGVGLSGGGNINSFSCQG